MRNEVSSGILVYREKDQKREYLFLRKGEDYLDFSKGHIEKGESEIVAAKRETFEETGLMIEPIPGFREEIGYHFKSNGQTVNKKVIVFVGRADSDSRPKISHEHMGYEWMDFKRAMKELRYATQKNLLKKAEDFLQHRET
jgi:8-oxo-dGTP pyrophosphatase MutT (NUDIX family)